MILEKNKKEKLIKQELFAIKLSLIGCIAIAILAFIIGICVDSVTLILDSGKRFVAMAAVLLSIFVIKNIHKSADGRYHFGYSKYEPLTVVIEGILIIAVCFMSVKFAIQDIIHSEDILRYDIPIAFTAACGFFGFFLGLYLRRTGKIVNSSILTANGWGWYLDGLFSFGICAGFTLGFILKVLNYGNLSHYVDPVMTLILVSIIISHPLKTIKHHILELVDASPGEDVEKSVLEAAERLKRKYGISNINRIRLRKAGRKVFIELLFSLKEKENIAKINKITAEITQELSTKFSHFDIVVAFELNEDSDQV